MRESVPSVASRRRRPSSAGLARVRNTTAQHRPGAAPVASATPRPTPSPHTRTRLWNPSGPIPSRSSTRETPSSRLNSGRPSRSSASHWSRLTRRAADQTRTARVESLARCWATNQRPRSITDQAAASGTGTSRGNGRASSHPQEPPGRRPPSEAPTRRARFSPAGCTEEVDSEKAPERTSGGVDAAVANAPPHPAPSQELSPALTSNQGSIQALFGARSLRVTANRG